MQFTLSITLIIIIITAGVSISAFSSRKLMDDLIFYPAIMKNTNQFYRFISYGFVHGGWMHLIFNMYAFYLFGEYTETEFKYIFGPVRGSVFYLLLYIVSLVASVLPDFIKYKDNYQYRSLGASGAVSAVVFAFILFEPLQGIGLIFIPFYIAGFLFGILFLIGSFYLGKRGGSVINHLAHLWGAIFGFLFTLILCESFSDVPVWKNFLGKILNAGTEQLFRYISY